MSISSCASNVYVAFLYYRNFSRTVMNFCFIQLPVQCFCKQINLCTPRATSEVPVRYCCKLCTPRGTSEVPVRCCCKLVNLYTPSDTSDVPVRCCCKLVNLYTPTFTAKVNKLKTRKYQKSDVVLRSVPGAMFVCKLLPLFPFL